VSEVAGEEMIDPVSCLLAVSSAVKLLKTAVQTTKDLESLGGVLGQFFTAKSQAIQVVQQSKTKGFKGSAMAQAIELELKLEEMRNYEEQIKMLFFSSNKMDVWAKIVARAASIDKEAAHDARREREAAERHKKEVDEVITLVLMLLVLGALLAGVGWLIYEVMQQQCGGKC
jgi:hypothetical protein